MPTPTKSPGALDGGYWYTPIKARLAHYIRRDGAMLCDPSRVFMAASLITSPPYKTPERCGPCESMLKNEEVAASGHNPASNTSTEAGK